MSRVLIKFEKSMSPLDSQKANVQFRIKYRPIFMIEKEIFGLK